MSEREREGESGERDLKALNFECKNLQNAKAFLSVGNLFLPHNFGRENDKYFY